MHGFTARARVASAFLLALVAGCNGGGGGGSSANPTLTVAVTDSASDDVESFLVDVTSIRITKLGGAVVGVLASPARIDLATLTDTSQVLNVINVPPGTYVAAEITLDFTNATCVLVGQTTPAAILDVDGNPLTGTLTLPIQLGQHPLGLPFNKHKLLEFDFDLEQSVSADTANNTVSVEPAFVLKIDPLAAKTLIVLGTLQSVDTAAGTFVAQVQTPAGVTLGTATFRTGTTSVYQIDGVPSQGAAGLVALAAVPVGTWIQVYGAIDPLAPTIFAAFVEAGTGTYNGGTDIVEGHVIDRVGGPGTNAILTVIGHSNNAAHTVFQFNTTFIVTATFADTMVVRRFDAMAFDLDDVNVGQRVRVFGTLTGTSMDAMAANDVIRLQPTRVFGHASGPIASGSLTIDLDRVDLRPESAFNWAGGGSTPPDPMAFTLTVGSLGTSLGIVGGTAVEARGFLPAVDDAGDDFTATSLQNRDLAPSLLLVRNRPGGFTVTPTATASQIQLAISGTAGTGEIAIVDHGFVGAQALPTSPAPIVQPSAAGPTFYFLRDKGTGSVALYLDFAAFSSALATKIAQGGTLASLAAVGTYTLATNTIRAPIASAIVE